MPGGPKLSHHQERAVAALLVCRTIPEAASASGVNVSTLERWLSREEGFKAVYREARRRVVEHAITSLQNATTEAVETLRENLSCGKPATEVRAASIILEHALSALAWQDVEGRLAALERSRAQNERNGSRH